MIHKLDEETVELIAAGEVVQNPASIVKELVENSLDADASSVEIEVENGGIDRVRVSDDGHGMDAENAELAFERHATSKISDADDVSAVDTLGFRGEALPSIARVARVEMVTKAEDGVGATRVVTGAGVEGIETDETGRARGTTVDVTRLFEKTPARRASLSTPKREFRRVSRLVTRYALARPEVAFRLEHDGRETLSTSGSGDPVDALYAVYGREVASRATRFSYEDGRVAVEGALVRPSVTRSETRHVYTAVNGRALDDETVRKATVDGYGNLLPKNRYPVAVVSVDVPPERVNVNVHPAKKEVRFADEDAVRRVVSKAVRDALTNEDLTRRDALDLDAPVEELESSGDSAFSDAEVIGQFRDLYLLCESGDDLLVVDQHAAHERVNYEELRAEFNGSVPSVELDEAVTVDLSPEEAAVIEDRGDSLRANGFRVEEFGGGLYRVRGVPAPMGRVGDTEVVHDVLDRFVAGEEVDLRDEIMKDVACHPSLKAGDELTNEEATSLVRALGDCKQPFACPHGRPTVLSVNERRIAEGFERGSVRL
jgi:DNA mismatch repair protein MutL